MSDRRDPSDATGVGILPYAKRRPPGRDDPWGWTARRVVLTVCSLIGVVLIAIASAEAWLRQGSVSSSSIMHGSPVIVLVVLLCPVPVLVALFDGGRIALYAGLAFFAAGVAYVPFLHAFMASCG